MQHCIYITAFRQNVMGKLEIELEISFKFFCLSQVHSKNFPHFLSCKKSLKILSEFLLCHYQYGSTSGKNALAKNAPGKNPSGKLPSRKIPSQKIAPLENRRKLPPGKLPP